MYKCNISGMDINELAITGYYCVSSVHDLYYEKCWLFVLRSELGLIKVKPPGQEKENINDMRSLSGGERSFSTVCFIRSLWEITESPFRCLDEFDVYMVRITVH